MATVGPGVEEIRVHTAVEYRVLYVARFGDGVYVLHAFQKRNPKTPKRDLDLARERLRALLAQRRGDNARKAGTG
jgi:phage-related protein